MIYRVNPKNGDKISQLAFGCMRFPKDEEAADRLVGMAIENGINYFDTAYVYLGNEAVLGRLLKKDGRREKVKLATKLPAYLVRRREDFDKFFDAQLERLQTDHIDYYMSHMLTSLSDWQRVVDMGIVDWINGQKANGRIVNMGFSFHGGASDFVDILEAYDWDFCMMQYNYLDVNNQAGRSGLERAKEMGVPVMIMEPLRGGKLAHALPPRAREIFDNAEPKRSYAEWALRWLWDQEGILSVLSGMNEPDMVLENVRVASEAEIGGLSGDQKAMIERAREIILDAFKVPCTGCNYCLPCPVGVDIPLCFSFYNDLAFNSKMKVRANYTMRAFGHNASKCVKCGKCEPHCPQSIRIRDELDKVKGSLESFPYGPMRFVIKHMMNMK